MSKKINNKIEFSNNENVINIKKQIIFNINDIYKIKSINYNEFINNNRYYIELIFKDGNTKEIIVNKKLEDFILFKFMYIKNNYDDKIDIKKIKNKNKIIKINKD